MQHVEGQLQRSQLLCGRGQQLQFVTAAVLPLLVDFSRHLRARIFLVMAPSYRESGSWLELGSALRIIAFAHSRVADICCRPSLAEAVPATLHARSLEAHGHACGHGSMSSLGRLLDTRYSKGSNADHNWESDGTLPACETGIDDSDCFGPCAHASDAGSLMPALFLGLLADWNHLQAELEIRVCEAVAAEFSAACRGYIAQRRDYRFVSAAALSSGDASRLDVSISLCEPLSRLRAELRGMRATLPPASLR